MEKLIELLNEFHFFDTEYIGYYLDKEENRIYFKTEVVDKGITNEERISNERIISKKFGFIKRLVGNDKIDLKKWGYDDDGFSGNLYERGIAFVEDYDNDTYKVVEFYSPYLQLLMLLAIQDNPIEFLISILK